MFNRMANDLVDIGIDNFRVESTPPEAPGTIHDLYLHVMEGLKLQTGLENKVAEAAKLLHLNSLEKALLKFGEFNIGDIRGFNDASQGLPGVELVGFSVAYSKSGYVALPEDKPAYETAEFLRQFLWQGLTQRANVLRHELGLPSVAYGQSWAIAQANEVVPLEEAFQTTACGGGGGL